MLVLSRKVGEQIVIGDNITVVVNKLAGNRISLGIEAPAHVRIVRGELKEATSAFDDEHVSDSSSDSVRTPDDLQPGLSVAPTDDFLQGKGHLARRMRRLEQHRVV